MTLQIFVWAVTAFWIAFVCLLFYLKYRRRSRHRWISTSSVTLSINKWLEMERQVGRVTCYSSLQTLVAIYAPTIETLTRRYLVVLEFAEESEKLFPEFRQEFDDWMTSIHEKPDDDTTKLAFADWLNEHGCPESARAQRQSVQFSQMVRNGQNPGAL